MATCGTSDENLLPVLLELAEPTFCTLDRHFFRRDWVHPAYALVWLDVPNDTVALFIRRYLKHSAFDVNAKRLGTAARVRASGLRFWRNGQADLQAVAWDK